MSNSVTGKNQKFKEVNPFIKSVLLTYCTDRYPNMDIADMFKALCRELSKYPNREKDRNRPSSNVYFALIHEEKVCFVTTGYISQQFQCINNKKGEATTNVVNRNKLFVYSLFKWLTDNAICLPVLKYVQDESSAFDLLYAKIFKEREIKKSNYMESLINSERESARFIFCCCASGYYKDVNLDFKLTSNKPEKLMLPDMIYNIKQDVIWRSIWGDKKLNLEILGRWASDIIKKSIKQPLFHLILNKWSIYKARYVQYADEKAYKHSLEYHKAYLILLRSSIDFNGNTVNILPCTLALSDYIAKKIKILVKETEFTVKDLMSTYGTLASITSVRENWRFNACDIRNSCTDKKLKDGIASLVNSRESLIAKEGDKNDLFKFSIKPYRIFFKALHDADEFNYRERASYPVLFESIYDLSKISFVNSDLVNLDESFVEDVIVYSSILIRRLEEKRRNGFIEFLINKSKSFGVSDRPDQILAIYILTIILSECSEIISSNQRKLIYENTYAKVAYKIQTLQFENLIESSPFYLNEIIRTFNNNFCSWHTHRTKTLPRICYVKF